MKNSTIATWVTFAIAMGYSLGNGFAQSSNELSEIEKKFAFVEIWDVKGRSRREFLEDITSRPASICQQSLVEMGHPDGHKFPLASGKLLLTTRSSPDYRVSSTYRRLATQKLTIENDKWASLNTGLMRTTEAQLLPLFLNALDRGDNEEFDRIYSEQKKVFAAYRIELDADTIRASHRAFTDFSRRTTKNEVLSILYLSHDNTLLQSASSQLSRFLQNGDDLLEALPLLLRQDAGVQAAIETFIDGFGGKIEWSEQFEIIPSLVNNPNPFRTILVLKILDKTGFTTEQWDACSFSEYQTLVEILSSDVLSEEKSYVLSFLNRYSTKPLGDAKDWLARLRRTKD